ncbi:OmpL47-type beta-barrel domain-containing protein [Paenibacillus methanolicus]|uniref:PKD domain-containing protein n=1 Tax=Paenibacillus methanolicus TaxID=582686 RepID=A0A5S5CE34_9BACL|nr:PKD domain-containing protein [Paenibacillus methanolicus]TYP76576.1 PKD domain-containing protein [Paenibacillus methanolicus]
MKRFKTYSFVAVVMMMLISMLELGTLLPVSVVHATGTTYYVSPTGSASHDGLSTAAPWTLTKAAATAAAGDTVLFMDGVYSEQFIPQNSGTAGNPITFKAMNAGQTTLTYAASDNFVIKILGKSHLALSGFKVTSHLNKGKWIMLDSSNGTAGGTKNSNITISDCVFNYATAGWGPRAPFSINYTEQLKLLRNSVTEAYDGDDLITVANSSKLLIEGNNFNKARHTVFAFGYAGAYHSVRDVVVRNNVFNSQWSRNFEIAPNSRILLEGNVFAEQRLGSGNAASRNSIHANQVIFRYNRFIRNYGSGTLGSSPYETGLLFKDSVFYNNVFAENDTWVHYIGDNYALRTIQNNFYKNNIFYNNDNNASNKNLRYNEPAINPDGTRTISFIRNNFWHGPGVTPMILGTDNNVSNYNLRTLAAVEAMSQISGSQVPLFDENTNVNPLFTDPGNYNFTLQAGSPMIDGGANLTKAVGAGHATATITVENPNYFYDGFGIGGEQGDLISVGSSGNRARIINIAYTTDPATGVVTSGVLTLDTPLTWADGASVNLAYAGSAPDLGIAETGAAARESLQVATGQFKSVTGTAVPFSASVYGSFAPVSYSWKFGDGSTGTGATPSHAYAQPGQYMVYCTATDAAGKTISGTTYVIIHAVDYLSQPLVYNSFDADDRLYAQLYRHGARGNEAKNIEQQFENGTNGVIHVFFHANDKETRELRFGYNPPDWNIDQFPIVSAKYKVNKGTPLVLALEAYQIRWDDDRTYPIAATESANQPTAVQELIDDGQWHTIEVDVREIRNLGGTYAGLSSLRSAGFRLMAPDNTGKEYWVDDFSIKPETPPPVTAATVSPETPDGSNGWYTSDVTISLATNNAISKVARTEYRVNDGPWVPYTGSIPPFSDGEYTFHYRSVDQAGRTESSQAIAFKVDTTAPELTVRLDKTSIWPANHKMVTVNAALTTNDDVSGVASVNLTSITSDEQDSGQGDIQAAIGTPASSFALRAERSGNGDGRTYTVTYTATDQAGNQTVTAVPVIVPHDQSHSINEG